MINFKDIDPNLLDDSDMYPTPERIRRSMENRRKSLLREFDFLNPSMSLSEMDKLVEQYYNEHPELLDKLQEEIDKSIQKLLDICSDENIEP